jgi:putative hydrolase of the HAD superfamily
MGGDEVRGRAVLLDAMGTLLTFADPAPRLRAALLERLGVDVGETAARAAIRAEIAHYRSNLHRGRDPASLAALRAECAAAMRPALGLDPPVEALLDALAFSAYPDAAPALRALRAAGRRLVVVSNWDSSLHERLQETARSRRPSWAPPSPTAPSSSGRSRWPGSPPRTPGTSATISPPTSRARSRRGSGPC